MKNEKILELLNNNKIEELKKILTEEIKLEGYKNKNTYKTVKNHLLKACKNKPVLQYCNFKEDKQIITDTYFLSSLVKEDYNPLIEKYEDVMTYPNIDGVVSGIRYRCIEVFEINSEEFLEMIHELKTHALRDNKDYIYIEKIKRHFNIKLLEIAISTLNLNKNTELKIYFNDNTRHGILIEKSNGSFTIVLPVIVKE